MALIRADTRDLPGTETEWRSLLIGLTPGWPDGEAWELVVEDWTRPALLQPPIVQSRNRDDYRSRLATPDALDILVTAKNHDVKRARMTDARDEDWLLALVTLQTNEGFLGAGSYGISRMNGGFASRMSLGVRPAGGPSAAFGRDVRRLVEINDADGRRRNGLPLVWLDPWDGTRPLAFETLDPLYVEICRRVRLVRRENGIEALAAGSKVARIAAAPLKGRTGDPWAPIKADGTASVTPNAGGFGYRQITRLLSISETVRPSLAELAESDPGEGLAIVASALVRGQGKTEGLHRRVVPLSRSVSKPLRRKEYLDRMGRVAELRTKEAGGAAQRLRRALITLVQGGPKQPRADDDAAARKIASWMARFDLAVDREFFGDRFWAEFNEESASHRTLWRRRLREMAVELFEQAAEAAPRTEMRRVRARARARDMLERQLYKFMEEVDGQ